MRVVAVAVVAAVALVGLARCLCCCRTARLRARDWDEQRRLGWFFVRVHSFTGFRFFFVF